MTNEEAKFILSAYRPSGADARNAVLTDALEQARRDPGLNAWFERSQALDRVVAEKLGTVQPPANLRASLLAGVRVSQVAPKWWSRASVWAVAAALTVLLALGAVMWRGPGVTLVLTSTEAIREVARADLGGPHPMSVKAGGLGEFGAWLQNPANRLAGGMPVNEAQLTTDHCRVIEVAGHRVFEICFRRDAWYHVYIAPRDGFDEREFGAQPRFEEAGEVAMATWADASYVYVLATAAGINALKGVL